MEKDVQNIDGTSLLVRGLDGEYTRKSFNPETSTWETFELSETDRNVQKFIPPFDETPEPDIEETKIENPESFLTDLKRIGLNVGEGPIRLMSDIAVRPFVDNKEDYDKKFREVLNNVNRSLLGAIGDTTPEDVIDPETNKLRDPDTFLGKGLNIGTYIAGTHGLTKALGPTGLNIIARGVIGEQVTEQALADPNFNLANLAPDFPVLEYLAADKDDDVLLNRAKMAIVSSALTGTLFAGGKASVEAWEKLGFDGFDIGYYAQRLFNKEPSQLIPKEMETLTEKVLKLQKEKESIEPTPMINSLKENAKENAEGVAQVVSQNTSLLSRLQQRFFSARGFFSEQAYEAQQMSIARTRQLQNKAKHIAFRLDKILTENIARTGNETIIKKVSKALEDEKMFDMKTQDKLSYLQNTYKLNKKTANEVVKARKLIDGLSKTLLNSNVGTETVRSAIQSNLGEYLTRSYRAFEDPSFVPDPDHVIEAKEYLVGAKKAATGLKEEDLDPSLVDEFVKAADQEIDELIDKASQKNYIEYVTKLRNINKNYFKERKDIPKEIRVMLGEIENPTENIILTVKKLSSVVETSKFFKTLEELGGAVPVNKELYTRSLKLARQQARQINLEDAQKKFREGSFVTLKDGRIGKITSVGEDGVYTVSARNKDGSVSDVTDLRYDPESKGTSFGNGDVKLIPTDNVINTLTNKIYREKGGGFTEANYIYKDRNAFPGDPTSSEYQTYKNTFNTAIKGTGTSLDGQLTTPELARAISNLEDTFVIGGDPLKTIGFFQHVSAIKGFNQQMRTVWDTTTHLRNAIGGTQFGLANGINPFYSSTNTYKTLKNELFGAGKNQKLNDFYEKMQGLGVINTSVKLNEIRALIEVGAEATASTRLVGKIEKIAENYPTTKLPLKVLKGTDRTFEKIYMATDDFFKMNAWKYELEVLKQAKPNTPLRKLELEAAAKVKNTMPNYDRVPKGFKALRELPVGNFISFPAEIARTSYNIVELGTKEMLSGNPVLRKRGARRLASFGVLNAGWYTAGALGHKLLGFDEQETEALNTLHEGYTKNHNKQFVVRNGELFTHDPTYINSYNMLQDLALTFHRELSLGTLTGEQATERLNNAGIAVVKKMLEPFLELSMFAETFNDIGHALQDEQGRTPDGKQLWTTNRFEDKLLGSVVHLYDGFAPGILLDAEKLGKALFEVPSPRTGEVDSKYFRVLEMTTGLNFRKTNVEDEFQRHARTYVGDTKFGFATKAKADYSKDPDDLFKHHTESTAIKYESAQELYRHILSMEKLDYGFFEIDEFLKEAGIRDSLERAALIDGEFYGIQISESQIEDIEDVIQGTEAQKTNLINDLLSFNNYANNLLLHPTEEGEVQDSKIIREGVSLKKFRKGFVEGGVVDVPYTKDNAAERVNPLTGLPYTDQFEDPLQRLGFFAGGTYKIQAGDTLSEIAKQQDISQEELQRINRIENPDVIRAGEILELPKPEEIIKTAIKEKLTNPVIRNKDPEAEKVAYEIGLMNEDEKKHFENKVKFTPKTQIGTFEKDDLRYRQRLNPETGEKEGYVSNLMGRLENRLNKIGKDFDEGQYGAKQAALQHTAAVMETMFMPIGDLFSAIIPDRVEKAIGEKVGQAASAVMETETAQDIAKFLDENPEYKGYSKSALAGLSILGTVAGGSAIGGTVLREITKDIPVLQQGFYSVGRAAQPLVMAKSFLATVPKTVRDNLYNANLKTEGFSPTGRKEIADLSARQKQFDHKVLKGGMHTDEGNPKYFNENKIPYDEPPKKGTPLYDAEGEPILIKDNLGWTTAAVIKTTNIMEQLGQDLGYLIKGAPTEKAYAFEKMDNMTDDAAISNALGNKYRDKETTQINKVIADRYAKHVKAVNVAPKHLPELATIPKIGGKLTAKIPDNSENTIFKVLSVDGPTISAEEIFRVTDRESSGLMKKLFYSYRSRKKFANFINLTNKDGTFKDAAKTGKAITERNNIINKIDDVKKLDYDSSDAIIAKASPAQLKAWIEFDGIKDFSPFKIVKDASGKNVRQQLSEKEIAAKNKQLREEALQARSDTFGHRVNELNAQGLTREEFKGKNFKPRYFTMTDSNKSNAKELGGVNQFFMIDLKTKDVHIGISDKHDVGPNIDPLGGKSLVAAMPLVTRNLVDLKSKSKPRLRNYPEEARAAKEMLAKMNATIKDGNMIIDGDVNPILADRIPDVKKGTTAPRIIDENILDELEKAKLVDGVWYRSDGKTKLLKHELNTPVVLNNTALSFYKPTEVDMEKVARRLAKITAVTAPVSSIGYQETPKEGRLQRALKKTRS